MIEGKYYLQFTWNTCKYIYIKKENQSLAGNKFFSLILLRLIMAYLLII